MIKRILLSLLIAINVAAYGQQGTASPYSFFGIGDVKFKGTAENRLMGGTSVFTDSIHLNLQNPASYSSLKLTTLTLGASFNSAQYTSYQGTEKAQRTTLDYIAVGLPITKKIGVSFGLMPYTSVGYRMRVQDINGTIRKYNGTGGLNRVYAGASYKVMENWHLGADIGYHFGNIKTSSIVYIPEVQFGTKELNSTDLSGFYVNLGTMYRRKIKSYDFYGALSYTPGIDLNLSNTRTIGLIEYVEDYDPGIVQQLETSNGSRKLQLPSKWTLGAGFGKERKWLVGGELTLTQAGSFGNRFGDISNATFENGFKYNFGGYYIPNFQSFSSYFAKIVYRAGFRYEYSGMVVNGAKIRDYAVTGGFGFPLGGTFSNLNAGVELGRMGTAKANLVEQNYLNVILSLSLNDQWFVKRRYD